MVCDVGWSLGLAILLSGLRCWLVTGFSYSFEWFAMFAGLCLLASEFSYSVEWFAMFAGFLV